MAVRGLYLAAPKPDEIPLAISFIREALPKESVNVLVMEFDYRYSYVSHPEVVTPTLFPKQMSRPSSRRATRQEYG